MRLLVIGNAALDRCYRVDRLPREGESVLAASAPAEPGGKCLNQAVMAARAGAEVTLLAVLGCDDAGAVLRRHLRAEGLDGPFLLEHAGPSDESIVLVGPSGDNLIVTTHAAAASLPPEAARAAIATLAPDDGLLMQGNLDERTTIDVLAAARARGVRTIFNPSPLRPGTAAALVHVDILIANVPEAAALADTVVPVTIRTAGRTAHRAGRPPAARNGDPRQRAQPRLDVRHRPALAAHLLRRLARLRQALAAEPDLALQFRRKLSHGNPAA